MAETKCAKAVMLAAIAASGLVGTASPVVLGGSTRPEVTLSRAVAGSTPLAHLQSTATTQIASVNVDQGNMHVHINQQARPGESSFEV